MMNIGPKFRFQKNKKSNSEAKENVPFQRSRCLCEASSHGLVNNCLNCGRIVCEKEGSGPCFTCGVYVASKAERQFLLSNSPEAKRELEKLLENGEKLDPMLDSAVRDKQRKLRFGEDIVESLYSRKNNEDSSLQKAIDHKDRLLEYDKKSIARTKVLDDQVDYFTLSTQNFISSDKRNEINSRVDYIVQNKFNKEDKLVLNLETGTVSDTRESIIKDLDAEHQKLQELSHTKSDYKTVSSSKFLQQNNNDSLPVIYLPSEDGDDQHNKFQQKVPSFMSMKEYNHRVQDKEQDMLEDKGMCLAMRQPWATLLVAGIKKFEGRTWYSPFKGRLWIYAAQHRPSSEEIERVEKFYRQLGVDRFPRNYPTGEIVGCVTVEDCLPNSVYSEQYPECEIDSPYAFVCTYPLQFQTPIPVHKGGGDKIYPLQASIHRQCKRALGF